MKKGGRIALTAGILLLAACIAVPHISTQHYIWAGITGADGMKVKAALPANAAVRIGFNKEQLIAFAASDAPMNAAQLCAHFLMPTLLLGILPVCISLLLRKKHPAAQMFFLFFGIGSLIVSPVDWVVLTAILRSIPAGATVQISETVPYWYIR